MGCPLRHYGNARKLIDLSGLLLIVKLSIQSIRVCTYIAPNEFQGSKTNGITAAIASGIATIAASAGGGGGGPSRRKSTTGYHTPFAPEPKEVKSRRVSELTVEEEGAANGKAEDGNDPGIAGNNTGETASGWGDDVSVSSGLQGSKRKIVWSTTDLIPESIDAAAGSGGGDSTANAKPSGGEKASKAADAKEDIMMCVLDSNPSGSGSSSTDKFLNLCVILDFPEKSLGVSIEAVDVQCALGPLSVTVGQYSLFSCLLYSDVCGQLCMDRLSNTCRLSVHRRPQRAVCPVEPGQYDAVSPSGCGASGIDTSYYYGVILPLMLLLWAYIDTIDVLNLFLFLAILRVY